jgi:pre-mRNA-splicing factor CDC5/CEF1
LVWFRNAATGGEDGDDSRKLRPGEIDPTPEVKPALPDAVDMDEDEKEMLQEARARLANTRGKKAKRKAREKQLEEAKRLATLQKRRELKAAGIDVTHLKPRTRGIDYNKEIPFQRKAPVGFFDAAAEQNKKAAPMKFKSISLSQLEGPRRDEQEERMRKLDARKRKDRAEKDPAAIIAEMNRANDRKMTRRGKLNLPEPQISDRELSEIAKMTYDVEEDDHGDAPTRSLLSSYAPTPTPGRAGAGGATPSLVERTPARPDLLAEAQNLARLTASATPLLGGDNPELNPVDFSTGQQAVVQTPNPLLTPLRNQGSAGPVHGSGMTPRRTPLRDQLAINDVAAMEFEARQQSRGIFDRLSALPTPKNEYRLVAPQVPTTDSMDVDEVAGSSATVSDGAELQRRKLRLQQQQAETEARLQSSVIKRGLPRPPQTPLQYARSDAEISQIEDVDEMAAELVKAEMVNMIINDAISFPTESVKPPKGFDTKKFHYQSFSEDELAEARHILTAELELLQNQFGEPDLDDYINTWNESFQNLVYVPSKRGYSHTKVLSAPEKLRFVLSVIRLLGNYYVV